MAKPKERTCHICGTRCTEFCPTCVENFKTRRNAEEMTGEERAKEMELLFGALEMPFPMVHERIEELVGRPVFTHEIGLNSDGLIQEARNRQHPSLKEVVDLIPPEKRIIVVAP